MVTGVSWHEHLYRLHPWPCRTHRLARHSLGFVEVDVNNENTRKEFETWAEPRGFMIESYQGQEEEWFFSDDDTQLNFECWQAVLSKLAAETLRADTAEAELTDMQHWRDLALQFDNHRMNAMFHLKTLVSDGAHYDAARNFLSEQPLSAHEVVEKLAAAEQRVSELEITMSNAVEWFDDGVGRSDAEFDILQRMRATLNPQTRGRKS